MNPVLEKATHLIPDKLYLRLKFLHRMGRWLNLKNPQTFNEKLQWLKLHDRNPIYSTMVDKYEAKKYVASIIGEEYIVPTLGVWDRFEDIDFEALPDQFVLKCTHDSGGLCIVRDKHKMDTDAVRKKMDRCMKRNYFWHGREWAYKNVKPRIICEAYLEDEGSAGLTDYKFFCFHQEPGMLYISRGLENHKTAQISFYDLDGKRMPFKRSDFEPIQGDIQLPDNFQEMLMVARKIAKEIPCPFVRVDLYSVKGKVYSSEITFSPCSGWIPFEPKEWDKTFGALIKLPEDRL